MGFNLVIGAVQGDPGEEGRTVKFYLGAHHPSWLWDETVDFPLFVSYRSLRNVRKLRRSTHPWALDSGGFTEIDKFGDWTIDPGDYVEAVARVHRDVGLMTWAAPMDRMCEPWIIAKIGTTVLRHQNLTVENFCLLRELWPAVSDDPCPFIPVLQGWSLAEYLRCIELYLAAGVDLTAYPTVGLGSVCRRQNALSINNIVSWLANDGLKLHGFGVKTDGLDMYGAKLVSADSLSWSKDALHNAPLPGHAAAHKHCNNCADYAADWRRDLLDRTGLGV
jgi:hypothetical protein